MSTAIGKSSRRRGGRAGSVSESVPKTAKHESDGTYILEAMVSPGQHQCLSRSAAVRLVEVVAQRSSAKYQEANYPSAARVLNRRLAGKGQGRIWQDAI